MRTLYPHARAAVPTPLGFQLIIEADEDAIVSARFARARRGLTAATPRHAVLREAAAQVRAYFRKRLLRFDVPLRLAGTPLQTSVWLFVSHLEFGEIVSYADVARIVGRPGAHRGVAAAMGKTPIDLFVPAHRVVGSDGTVRGAGPQSLRRRLLAFEGIRLR